VTALPATALDAAPLDAPRPAAALREEPLREEPQPAAPLPDEPPTEPLAPARERVDPSPLPAPATPAPPPVPRVRTPFDGSPSPPPASAPASPVPPHPTPFDGSRYVFATGLRAGQPAVVTDGNGAPLLAYRSFASIVGIVAALMTAIVGVAGLAAVVFLAAEGRPLAAIVAVALSIAFAGGIAMLVPPLEATLFDGQQPAIRLTQFSRFSFPSVTYAIVTGNGGTLARVRRSLFSRLGRNRWVLLAPAADAIHGLAVEESLSRAFTRKLLAKFSRASDANVILWWEGKYAGTIVRRAVANGAVDYLDLAPDVAMDRRLAVAIAALILGSEP